MGASVKDWLDSQRPKPSFRDPKPSVGDPDPQIEVALQHFQARLEADGILVKKNEEIDGGWGDDVCSTPWPGAVWGNEGDIRI